MKRKNKKIHYYSDEANDDFQNTKTSLKVKVDGTYNYLPKSIFFRIFSFVFYYLIAFPLLTLADLLFFGVRVKGKKNLKRLKKQGFFIYANHTSYRDSWLAPISLVPLRRTYIISNKDAIQIPVVNIITKAAGVLPVADTVSGLKNLNLAVEKIIQSKKVVMIYPEAHIWPYYTKLRPFKTTSFRFAVQTKAPCVPVSVCYKKRKFFGEYQKPKMVVYIGKPIFVKAELSDKENARYLRDETYQVIRNTLKQESTFEYIQYVKLETPKETHITNHELTDDNLANTDSVNADLVNDILTNDVLANNELMNSDLANDTLLKTVS